MGTNFRLAALLVTLGAGPALAQTATTPGPRPAAGPPVSATTVPSRPADPAIEAQRRASEQRLRRREDSMKHLVRGICRGC